MGTGIPAGLGRGQAQQRVPHPRPGTDRRRHRGDLRGARDSRPAGAVLQHHELVRARSLPRAEHAARHGGRVAARLPLHRPHAHRGRVEDAAVPQVQADERAPRGVAQLSLAVFAAGRHARHRRSRSHRGGPCRRPTRRSSAITGTCRGCVTPPWAGRGRFATSSGSRTD